MGIGPYNRTNPDRKSSRRSILRDLSLCGKERLDQQHNKRQQKHPQNSEQPVADIEGHQGQQGRHAELLSYQVRLQNGAEMEQSP